MKRTSRLSIESLETRFLLTAVCGSGPTLSICAESEIRARDVIEVSLTELQAPYGDSMLVDWGDGRVDTFDEVRETLLHPYQETGSQQLSVSTLDGAGQIIETVSLNVDVVAGSIPVYHAPNRGLSAELFENVSPTDTSLPTTTPTATRLDPTLNFDFGIDAPDPAIPAEDFGIRWAGTIEIRDTENYQFEVSTGANDGVRLWVNGTILIDTWNAPTDEPQTCAHSLTAGENAEIKVEYRAGTGPSKMQLRWETPTSLNEVLPASRLSPANDVAAQGALLESWSPLTGNNVSDLTTSTAFIDNLPASATSLPQMEFLGTTADTDGRRMRAMLAPTVSGYHTFRIAADTAAELWLSTSDAAQSAQRVAHVAATTPFRNFDIETEQTSAPVFLHAGHEYYIEALHKSDGTNAAPHVSVGWVTPGKTLTQTEVIPAQVLQPVRPVVRAFADVSQTNEAEHFIDGASITFTRDDDFGRDLTVHYTIGGSAQNGVDYTTLAQTAVIPAGQDAVSIPVAPTPDAIFEGAEDVILRLISSNEYWLGSESETAATVTIRGEHAPGTSLLPTNAVLLPNIDEIAGDAVFTNGTTTDPNVPFTDLLQVDVNSYTDPWDIRALWALTETFKANDLNGLTGFARSNNTDLSDFEFEVRFESESNPAFGDLEFLTVGTEWTPFFVPFVSPTAISDLELSLRAGFTGNESVQFGGLELVAYDRVNARSLLPEDAESLSAITFLLGDDGAATFQEISVSDPVVTDMTALRIDVTTAPADVQPVWTLEEPIEYETPVTATGFIRSANADNSDATAEFRLELNSSPWSGQSQVVTATSTWQPFTFTIDAQHDYPAFGATFDMRVGSALQSVELSGLELITADYPVADLPSEKHSFIGREATATWREDAKADVELHRTNNLHLTVTDQAGNPVDDAQISVNLVRPDFEIGSTTFYDWFSPTTGVSYAQPEALRYRAITETLFHRTVDSGGANWIEWLNDPTGATETALWANDRGKTHRAHAAVWGNLTDYPAPTAAVGFDLEAEYNNQLATNGAAAAEAWLEQTLLDHINNNATAGLNGTIPGTNEPIIAEWDAINHPFVSPEIWDIVGDDFMLDVLQEIDAVVHVDTQLYINENDTLTGATPGRNDDYFTLASDLLNQSAPIDGIGFQSHFNSSMLPTIESIRTELDRFAQLGVDLQITEFDIDTLSIDPQTQADFTRDFMLAVASEPTVEAIDFWGFWSGHHWRATEGAALADGDFVVQPNGQVLLDYLQDQTATWTSSGHQTNFAGPAGHYEITVRRSDGTEIVQQVALEAGTTSLSVIMPQGALNNGAMEIGTNLNFVFQEEATNLLSEPSGGTHPNGSLDNERRPYVFAIATDWSNAYDFNAATGLSNFNPWRQEFLDDLDIYSQLRFLHWTNTNGSGIETWSERTDPNSDQTQLSEFGTASGTTPNNGIAWEWIIDLGNRLDKDIWINIPMKADNAYVDELATLIEERLDPNLNVYVEYHNEAWLTKPMQGDTQNTSQYAEDQAIDAGIDNGAGGFENVLRWYAHRSAEVWSRFRTVFGSSFDDRVVEVIAGQNANVNLGEQIRDFLRDPAINTTLPLELEDAFAIAPYFADMPITPATTFTDITTMANDQVAIVGDHVTAWGAVGTPVIAYEGGQSIVGLNAEPDSLVHDLNNDPEIKLVYEQYLTGLESAGLETFVHFTHSGTSDTPSANASQDWGAKAYIGQPATEAPKFAALAEFAGFPVTGPSLTPLIHDGAIATFETAGSIASTTPSIAADVPWIPQVVVTDLVPGPGVAQTNGWFNNQFAPLGWESTTLTEAISNDEYLSFTVEIEPGYTLDATTLDLVLRSQTQARNFALFSSETGFDEANILSDFGGLIQSDTNVDTFTDLTSFPQLENLGGTAEFRIYAYNDTPNAFEAIGIGDRTSFDLKLTGRVTDLQHPEVGIASPSHQSIQNGSPVTIDGTANDNSEISAVNIVIYNGNSLTWDGTAFTSAYTRVDAILTSPDTASTSWSYDFAPPVEDTYTFRATAIDDLGNESNSSWRQFTANSDATAPSIAVTAPANQSSHASTVNIEGTATDASGVTEVELTIYDAANQTWDGSNFTAAYTRVQATLTAGSADWSYDFIAPIDGDYVFRATAKDAAGNSADTAWRTFTISSDVTPPTIVVASPTTNTTYVGTVPFSGNATDNVAIANANIVIYDVNNHTWDGTAFTIPYTRVDAVLTSPNTSLTDWTYDFAGPTGSYLTRVTMFDTGGNQADSPWLVFEIL